MTLPSIHHIALERENIRYNNKKFVQYVLLQQQMLNSNELFKKRERKQINIQVELFFQILELCAALPCSNS